MARFFVEVPHEADTVVCTHAVRIFLNTGCHFLTTADWGCRDGEHKAWMTVEANTREEVRRILPPAYRTQAKIVQLNKFTMAEIEELLRLHQRNAA